MNPLRSLQFVPLPSMVTIGMALLVWTIWWWADQYQTATGPIVLAFALRLATLPGVKLWQEPQARQTYQDHPTGSLVVILCSVVAAGLAIWINSERLVQVVLTVIWFGWGAFVVWLAMFEPQDLDRRTSGINTAPHHASGINIIIGCSAILTALTSAALMRVAPDAVWVGFMSVGQVFILILARWVAVMWVLSQPDEPDRQQ